MIENKTIDLNWQEIQLLTIILEPEVKDEKNSDFTRKVAINILEKLKSDE